MNRCECADEPRTPTPAAPQGAPETVQSITIQAVAQLYEANARIAELEAELAEIKGPPLLEPDTEYKMVFSNAADIAATARNEALEEAAIVAYVLLLADIRIPKRPKDIRDEIRALKTPEGDG